MQQHAAAVSAAHSSSTQQQAKARQRNTAAEHDSSWCSKTATTGFVAACGTHVSSLLLIKGAQVVQCCMQPTRCVLWNMVLSNCLKLKAVHATRDDYQV
jgi:hypothetical protein